MFWKMCLGISIICFIVGLFCFLERRKKEKNAINYFGIGVFVSAWFICLPVFYYRENTFAFLIDVSHVLRMFVVDTGVSDITDYLPKCAAGTWWYYTYKSWVCVLYVLAPVFTLSIVLQYFSDAFDKFRLWVHRNDSQYVFSDLNDKALEIAENIKGTIIFCRSTEKDELNTELEYKARKLGAVFIRNEVVSLYFHEDKDSLIMKGIRKVNSVIKRVTGWAAEKLQLNLNRKRKNITYFLISEDETKNLDNSLKMIESNSKNENVEMTVYCFATSNEAEILIDAPDKGNLRVILVDEIREVVYSHLYQYPLYVNEKAYDKKKISLLLVGGGKVGTEFLKAAVWFGRMNSVKLEIYLIDKKADEVVKRLNVEVPELIKEKERYGIHILKHDIYDEEIINRLSKIENIGYCMVALGDDEENVKVSMWLRKSFYMGPQKNEPFICTYIESKEKRAAVWDTYQVNKHTKKNIYYNIIPFGGNHIYAGEKSSVSLFLEYLGIGIQFFYSNKDTPQSKVIRDFYSSQYNRRSSIASGMHIECKLWEIGYGIVKVPNKKQGKERNLFDQYIHKVNIREIVAENLSDLSNLEHDRWMAFMCSEGWQLATRNGRDIDSILECYGEYMDEFTNQNPLLKLHPAMVPMQSDDEKIATLEVVEKQIGLDYVQKDKELINHMEEIVTGERYNKEGILIQGIRILPDEYIICSLYDLQRYYKELYKKKKDVLSTQEVMSLRALIKQCAYGVLNIETDKNRIADTKDILKELEKSERGLEMKEK